MKEHLRNKDIKLRLANAESDILIKTIWFTSALLQQTKITTNISHFCMEKRQHKTGEFEPGKKLQHTAYDR